MTEIAASSFSKSKLENAFFITDLKSIYLIVTMLRLKTVASSKLLVRDFIQACTITPVAYSAPPQK